MTVDFAVWRSLVVSFQYVQYTSLSSEELKDVFMRWDHSRHLVNNCSRLPSPSCCNDFDKVHKANHYAHLSFS